MLGTIICVALAFIAVVITFKNAYEARRLRKKIAEAMLDAHLEDLIGQYLELCEEQRKKQKHD